MTPHSKENGGPLNIVVHQAILKLSAQNNILHVLLNRGKLGNGGQGEWRTLHFQRKWKESTMKLFYGNYYSFTRLWYVMIWEMYLNFGVKISKKQVNGFVYFSVHVTSIEQHMKIRSRAGIKYSYK